MSSCLPTARLKRENQESKGISSTGRWESVRTKFRRKFALTVPGVNSVGLKSGQYVKENSEPGRHVQSWSKVSGTTRYFRTASS